MKNSLVSNVEVPKKYLTILLITTLVVIGVVLIIGGFVILLRVISSQNSRIIILIALASSILTLIVPNLFRQNTIYSPPSFSGKNQTLKQQIFERELSRATDQYSVAHTLHSHLKENLKIDSLYIYLLDASNNQYIVSKNNDDLQTTDLYFKADSQLIHALSNHTNPILLNKSQFTKQISSTDWSRLAMLSADVIAPLRGQYSLVGFVVIGFDNHGSSMSESSLKYIDRICNQSTPAIERALQTANLEREISELKIINRVAQGVNITPAFDDILELVYAQTNQIIPCDDFIITLRNPTMSSQYHAFYLENNERDSSKENVSLPLKYGLPEQVLHSQKPIITDDYRTECLRNEIEPHAGEIYAWMSIPLTTGTETIGVISLGSRDPIQTYTNQHRNLLQAIADQTVGAIVKTRLIHETEQRTRQLAMLNEIGRGLTSTLEVNKLLNQILLNATEILNSQAGSLFMVDEHTGDLVFEVTAGPVANNLIGKRLLPGTGIVGHAVETGRPIIANDVHQSLDWSDDIDKQTGFMTRDLLVVPMQVKEKIIGIIEVINKEDGSKFDDEDQEILSTFASQAAIAVENARLYTQTDKALSSRVEELSVMQRIDRELNTSLDLERVLNITLEWSIRQSDADAGFLALIDNDRGSEKTEFRISISQGYEQAINIDEFLSLENEVKEFPLKVNSVNPPNHSQVLQSTEPEHQQHTLFAPSIILPNGKDQIVISIQRRNETIGLLVLESYKSAAFTEETIAFLSRLGDHASIAISNAQLYADLQAANKAKSDFVSLVSHEMKTPMTSIKGYADLLVKGAVGPINDAQVNFLNTIRSNVDRMSTLVSDLADVSRIEAGRLRLEFSNVVVMDVIKEIVRSAQAQIDERDQKLLLYIPENLPPVWADYNRLMQVMANLVNNASKYTPENGTLTISAEIVEYVPELLMDGVSRVVRIDVSDTGYGISEEDKKKIFQKFFRSEDHNIRETSGTGLGLNITRHLVEMQAGKIWFDSVLGEGTRFSFTIPVSTSNDST